MDKKSQLKPFAAALGTTFAVTLAAAPLAQAAENPFAAVEYASGYMLADAHGEGKCGGEKSGEGKCGGEKAGEGKCGGEKAAEGKCGGEKAAEGKCGGGSPAKANVAKAGAEVALAARDRHDPAR